ncbi:MAG TPA: beta-galactosidase [Abditibacterium sp.]
MKPQSSWLLGALVLAAAVSNARPAAAQVPNPAQAPATTPANAAATGAMTAVGAPRFTIGEKDFLLDGKRLQIRCGEIHFARVPREYWRDRLKRCKAMGLNAVCAYLFWNLHEFKQGQYNWTGQADAAEFCRMAQQEGLHVILRPGPYACAEWDGGGLPWWLLKKQDIRLRSQDPTFMAASRAWLKEVGRVLGPLQVSKGGPILMVQVENEYGSYGNDAEYMGQLRQATLDGGFDVPLFACNPPGALNRGRRDDLFNVVNFGSGPENGFRALRAVQPTGPLMCGEFYPGWFDTWGAPHHLGNTQGYLRDLEYMLKEGGSFSIYMAHGGTTFGLWPGADQPFKPDTNSYDYDAPIRENGDVGEKFRLTRELMSKYLLPGETLPPIPANNPTMTVAAFNLGEKALLTDNLPRPIEDSAPRHMEAYDQGQGAIMYRTTLPAGPATAIPASIVRDFAWVSLDGKQLGVLDRRARQGSIEIPARTAPARLDILVETMGHVNFGNAVHDRKGLVGTLSLGTTTPLQWQVFNLPLDDAMIKGLKFKPAASPLSGPQRAALLKSVPNIPKGATVSSIASSDGKTVVIKATVRNTDDYVRFVQALRRASKSQGGALFQEIPLVSGPAGMANSEERVDLTKGISLRAEGTLLKPIQLPTATASATAAQASAPQAAFYRGSFNVAQPVDTWLDLDKWGKGVIWINGRCLSRFWNIGPTQTAYVPGPWLRAGRNEVVVLDLVGPTQATMAGLNQPVLNKLRPELDFNYKPVVKGTLLLTGVKPAATGTFPAGPETQEVRFPAPVEGRQFLLEALSSQDGQPYTTMAELDLLDANGQSISHAGWSIAFADSEEKAGEDGSASNALDGQTNSFWHTEWSNTQPALPHQIAVDLGTTTKIGGFRYTPRQGNGVAGRIKDYRVFIGGKLVEPPAVASK